MIRSNCKKAITNIRNYILNHSDFDGYGIEEPKTWQETAESLMHVFFEEYFKHQHRFFKTYQECFISWLQGLPSVIDSCYYYNRSACDDLGEILEETEAEKARYTEDKAEYVLSALIWREIFKACHYCIK